MSRRRHKKEAARKAAQAAQAAPRPPRPRRPWEESLLGADGFVERLVRIGLTRETVLRGIVGVVIRLCRSSPTPDLEAAHFFASLGVAMAQDGRLGRDAQLYERCQQALRAAFYFGQYGEQVKGLHLGEEDLRILRRWRD